MIEDHETLQHDVESTFNSHDMFSPKLEIHQDNVDIMASYLFRAFFMNDMLKHKTVRLLIRNYRHSFNCTSAYTPFVKTIVKVQMYSILRLIYCNRIKYLLANPTQALMGRSVSVFKYETSLDNRHNTISCIFLNQQLVIEPERRKTINSASFF